jgi:lipopolysaccharide export system protein LptA
MKRKAFIRGFPVLALMPGLGLGLMLALTPAAQAQALGFGGGSTTPEPINITSSNGISWNQNNDTVTALGNAQAIRGKVTVTANRLIAHYKKTAAASPATGQKPAPQKQQDALSGLDSGQSQITRLDAVGNVHIFTATDQAFGDLAIYHMVAGELVLTGGNLRFITPDDTITARDAIEYFSKQRKAIAKGNALVVTKDQRSIAADTLVGYFLPPAAAPAGSAPAPAAQPDTQSGKLRRVDAFGHVIVRTATDIATGDQGVYHPATGIAILTGDVHITRGPNELAGTRARVNMNTGIATLLAAPGGRVSGMVLPNSAPAAVKSSQTPAHMPVDTGK